VTEIGSKTSTTSTRVFRLIPNNQSKGERNTILYNQGAKILSHGKERITD